MVDSFKSLASYADPSRTRWEDVRITGLCGPARSLVAAFLTQRFRGNTVLCVAPDWPRAEQFLEELRFFGSLFRCDEGEGDTRRNILPFPSLHPSPLGLRQAVGGVACERTRTVLALRQSRGPCVVVTSQRALREKIPPAEAFDRNTRELRKGDPADRDELAAFLEAVGYRRVPVLEAPGEYAVRGSLIDVYPLTSDEPYRIDFFGDVVDGIRAFSTETQRSRAHVESVLLPPAGMFIARAVSMDSVRDRIKERADALNLPTRNRLELVDRIESGPPVHEIPTLLPFLYPRLETLRDVLEGDVLTLLLDPDEIRRAEKKHKELLRLSLEEDVARGRVVPSVEDLYRDLDVVADHRERTTLVSFADLPSISGAIVADGDGFGEGRTVKIEARSLAETSEYSPTLIGPGAAGGLVGFAERIRTRIEEGARVFLVCGTEPEKMRFGRLLHEYGVPFVQPEQRLPFFHGPAALHLLRGTLSHGFSLPELGMAFVHEEDIFGKKVRRRAMPEPAFSDSINLKDLLPGDHVVHMDFGIGRFQGLTTIRIRDHINDYLHLEYANNDKLYLPVDRASRIQKYVSTEGLPPALDKLGGTAWARTKQRVRESVLAMAEELVSMYAVRTLGNGHAFSPADAAYQEFEASFPFEETPDQMRAIEEVLRDMEAKRPMDRLVCGDVGYGKTEVAVRAAYKAVTDGKQVAVLVPTTVLAQQHYTTFAKRFEGEPVEVRMLSRFRSEKEQRQIVDGAAEGRVDIVIGTHRLLQKDVRFRDLGLLILDEEHRFGVRHKEALKKLRAEVDVLTLTATPIPRTMQMSLLGLRDLSTIRTPPQDRHAIETYIVPFDEGIIGRALEYELDRGGQAFFVHNRVSDIEAVAEKLKRIVPRARVAVGHGQMPERSLERVMLEFVERKHDILVCTTIIESGLDISNVNTLLVNHADRFGLAQLYQLRGRVGRSERQAFAYLIVTDEDTLSEDARKRLEVLYQFSELGSGFHIARYDLEIRGAGNLLGASQSGHVRAVGYDLYMEFLEKAIRKIRGEEVVEEIDPEIHLDLPAYLPREYVEDSTQRLQFYKRLASARDREETERIRGELEDRYGPLPPAAMILIELIHIKVRLRRMRVREARLAEDGLLLTFAEDAPVPVSRILEWAKREPDRMRIFPDHRLLLRFSSSDTEELMRNIDKVLAWLEK